MRMRPATRPDPRTPARRSRNRISPRRHQGTKTHEGDIFSLRAPSCLRAFVARSSQAGQVLEEYLLLLAFVAVPLAVALPRIVGALHAWAERLLAWWSLPIP